MTRPCDQTRRHVAIACGGTGGHVFPGLAVAEELLNHGCRVTLLISPKEVDQQALKDIAGFDVVTLPAVGLVRGQALQFCRGFRNAYRLAQGEFQQRQPQAALAMGGFTSAPAVLAARRLGACTFLHESNAVPGRANRWLSWIVDAAFVGFPSAAERLHTHQVKVTGTPVRRQFRTQGPADCREILGLDPGRPVVLVMGGSQGARGINELVISTLPLAARAAPAWQWIHLAGSLDCERVTQAYAAAQLKAVVQNFCSQMHLALGAATVAISRAGASALAELAAMQIPSILIPFPAAVDNHQHYNAASFAANGAAILLAQADATPKLLFAALGRLVDEPSRRERMRQALADWDRPQAAHDIAEEMLAGICRCRRQRALNPCSAEGGAAERRERADGETNSPHRLQPARVRSAGASG